MQYKRILHLCIYNLGTIVIIMAASFATIGSWLTAHEVIGVMMELDGYVSSLILVILGAIAQILLASRCTIWSTTVTIIGSIIALLVVGVSFRFSNQTFAFWKMSAVPPTAWKQMVSDLIAIDEKAKNENTMILIEHRKPPESFHALGILDDCGGGQAGVGCKPTIRYGVKDRLWGLVIGPIDHPRDLWIYRRVQPGENVWFFVGTD